MAMFALNYAAIALLVIAAVLAIWRSQTPGAWIKLAGIVMMAGGTFTGYAVHSLGATYQPNGTVLLGPYWRYSMYGAAIGFFTYALGAVVEELLPRPRMRHDAAAQVER